MNKEKNIPFEIDLIDDQFSEESEIKMKKAADHISEENIYPKKAKPITVHQKLPKDLKSLFENILKYEWKEEWCEDLPKKWKITHDLLILPSNCFILEHWKKFDSRLWETVAKCFNVKRVSQENKVKSDNFRSPNLTLLYGEDSFVTVCNNDIK